MSSPALALLAWYLGAQALALAALPVALRVFRRLSDRGYPFAKALGPLVVYGRTALFLYVAHHIVVVTLVQRALGLSLRSWPVWALATAALLVALLALALLWRALLRAARAEAPARVRLVY